MAYEALTYTNDQAIFSSTRFGWGKRKEGEYGREMPPYPITVCRPLLKAVGCNRIAAADPVNSPFRKFGSSKVA